MSVCPQFGAERKAAIEADYKARSVARRPPLRPIPATTEGMPRRACRPATALPPPTRPPALLRTAGGRPAKRGTGLRKRRRPDPPRPFRIRCPLPASAFEPRRRRRRRCPAPCGGVSRLFCLLLRRHVGVGAGRAGERAAPAGDDGAGGRAGDERGGQRCGDGRERPGRPADGRVFPRSEAGGGPALLVGSAAPGHAVGAFGLDARLCARSHRPVLRDRGGHWEGAAE